MSRSSEPFWWSLFAAGGVVAAFLMPATILVTGLLVPAGLVSADTLEPLLHQPLVRLYLFVVIALPLFHAAHRTRLTLIDLKVRAMRGWPGFLLYAVAVAGTLAAAWLVIRQA
jgi:fumarate reductase subunit D